MYAFRSRPDTRVVDEPLYAHYLCRTTSTARHPATAAILASQEQDGEKVVRQVLWGKYDRPVVLFKQMTHHLIELDDSFLDHMYNVILIRDPRAILASFSKVVERPSAADIGLLQQERLFQRLQSTGRLHAIVDARELLLDPPGVLMQLCEALELPYTDLMLHWPAGPKPEDGVWAPHWYRRVHASTGFEPYQEKKIDLPPPLTAIAKEVQSVYDRLYQQSIKATPIRH